LCFCLLLIVATMPKSRRDKDVSLTKVKKKGAEGKQKLIDEIRKCVDSYEHIFVFSVENMRNNKLKDVRQDFKTDSRFFFGKNKVTAVALGRIAEEAYAENLNRISKHLTGQTGLIFTQKPKEEVLRYFKELALPDFARAGTLATETIEFDAGPLLDLPFSLEPQLRKLGLPCTLEKGVIVLTKDHAVCQKGDPLTPAQARILKILGIRQAVFHVNLECVWTKIGAKFESITKKRLKKKIPEQEN